MIKNNIRLIFGVVGFICLVGVFFGIRSYIQWKGNYYFGQVTVVSEDGFTFSGLRSREYVVYVTTDTVIKKGFGVPAGSVMVGDRVIVVGQVQKDLHINATLVRIMGRKSNSEQ